jgi:hypothetical protein
MSRRIEVELPSSFFHPAAVPPVCRAALLIHRMSGAGRFR